MAAFFLVPTNATLEIRNESSHTVTIAVDTRIRREIPPHSRTTLYAGLLFRRWGPPGGILVDSAECDWDEVKQNEPLIVTDAGPGCRDVRENLPGGFH